jgi:hypothetical protein
VNAGTWIDHNTDLPAVGSRTFVVVTTGAAAGKDATAIYQFGETGNAVDVTARVSAALDPPGQGEPLPQWAFGLLGVAPAM